MRILEAGHYYSVKGPTKSSKIGWEVMKSISSEDDKSMLFIDDFHDWEGVPQKEKELPVVDFNPEFDYVVKESKIVSQAWEVLNILTSLSKKKRAKQDRSGRWFCSGFPITMESGQPNCVLLDAGLTLFKRELGFKAGVNILPEFYKDQQEKLFCLVKKALPDFHLQLVLYNWDRTFWQEY